MATRSKLKSAKAPSASPRRNVGRARQPQTAQPWFPIALFGLFAVGCAADYSRKQVPKKKPSYMSFQVDPTSALWAPAHQAASEWSAALQRSVTATADGEIPIFRVSGDCMPAPPDALPGQFYSACSKGVRTPDARIEVSEQTQPSRLLMAMRHE